MAAGEHGSQAPRGQALRDYLRPALEDALGRTLFFDTRAHLLAPTVELALAAIDEACRDHVLVHRAMLEGVDAPRERPPTVVTRPASRTPD